MLAYNPLNNNEWSFPLLEIIHITGFMLAVGTIALVDFRMLGLAFMRKSSARLASDLAPWTLTGLAVVLTSGPMILTSDPTMYLRNDGFRFKMAALLVAILYHYTVHRKFACAAEGSPGVRSIVALVSLTLWISVVFGGIFIAFVAL